MFILIINQMLKNSVYKMLPIFVIIRPAMRNARKCLFSIMSLVFVKQRPRSGNYPCSGHKQRINSRNICLIEMSFTKNTRMHFQSFAVFIYLTLLLLFG